LNSDIIQLGNLDTDKEYVIGIKNKEKKPQFTMTGDDMEALDVIANFSKPEAMAFILLKNNRDWKTNYVMFSTNGLSATDKVVFSKGYKSLASKGLIIRIKKGITSKYMFNPNFIIPNDYNEALVKWNAIKSKTI